MRMWTSTLRARLCTWLMVGMPRCMTIDRQGYGPLAEGTRRGGGGAVFFYSPGVPHVA